MEGLAMIICKIVMCCRCIQETEGEDHGPMALERIEQGGWTSLVEVWQCGSGHQVRVLVKQEESRN